MDLKKKFEEAKAKIKANESAIIAGVFIGTTIVLGLVNHRLKTEHAAQIDEWVADEKNRAKQCRIPDEYAARLKDGEIGHLTNPFEDFCMIIQKHDHPTED